MTARPKSGMLRCKNVELSAVDLRYIVKEAQFLVNSRVNKIYHPRKTELHLVVHISGRGRVVLTIFLPSLVFIGSEKESTEKPSGFCMGLRKRLINSRIRSIEQVGFDRILKIVFEKEETFVMYVELFRKGNVILTQEGKIFSAMLAQDGIINGKAYKIPSGAKDPEIFSTEELKELWTGDKSLVKWAASKLGLGGVYSEFLCKQSGLDKNSTELSDSDFDKLHVGLKSLLNQNINPCIVDEKVYPFNLKDEIGLREKSSSYLEAIAAVVTPQMQKRKQEDVTSSQTTKLEKHEKMVAAQTRRIGELKKQAVEDTKKGEFIYEHYQDFKVILEHVASLKGTELEDFLKNHPKIESYNLKDHTLKLKT